MFLPNKEVEVGSIEIEFMKHYFSNDNYHEMHIDLVRYEDRRYVSISRIEINRNDKHKITKKICNAIWIPLYQVCEVINLLKKANDKGDEYDWGTYVAECNSCDIVVLEKGESKQRLFSNIRETSRSFLISSANYLENKLSLNVNVEDVAKKMDIDPQLLIRVIDYLEDSGYIKQIKRCEQNFNLRGYLREYIENIFKNLPEDDIGEIIFERVAKNDKITREEFKYLDYLDSDDPLKIRWNYVSRFSEDEFLNEKIDEYAKRFPISFEITAAGYDWIE